MITMAITMIAMSTAPRDMPMIPSLLKISDFSVGSCVAVSVGVSVGVGGTGVGSVVCV